ncbi:MAG: OadG family protein [Bacteroidales bacterium]|nr:OadG family protein [Bacteroidales bacterium]
MKSISKYIILLALVFTTGAVFGQSVRDLRFNEILIKNTDNFDDEYGRHVPWVEIYNTAYNSVNLAGCFLTDDTTGFAAAGKKGGEIPSHWYHIPKTDVKTNMPQRSYIVFYLDAEPLYGTFHANFDPRTSQTSYIALISADGKDLIDLMHYPKQDLMDSTRSFGLEKDGITGHAHFLDQFTPGSSNEVKFTVSKQERLKTDDPYGIGLAIISMSVVFTALILIFFMLKLFGYSSKKIAQRNAAKNAPAATAMAATAKSGGDTNKEEDTDQLTGEEAAAIAMALHLHFNSMHDEESEVITIDMPSAHYSPWAQKGLVMKRTPRIRK